MVLSKQELWSKSSLWALSSYHGFFLTLNSWVTKTKFLLTNINNVKQKSDENDKKYKLGDYRLIQCQIL